MSDSSSTECKIFVGNVPYNCQQIEFSECFNKLKGYKHCEIIIRPGTSVSRGFGFVIFDNKTDADLLLNSDDDIILKDRTLRFSIYNKSEEYINNMANKDNNDRIKHFIYVSGLDNTLTSLQLREIFGKYGDLGMCYINTDRMTGQSKCTGVVEFREALTAEKLLKQNTIKNNNNTFILSPLVKKNINKNTFNGTRSRIITRNKINTKSQDYLAGFAAGRSVGFREGLIIKTTERTN